MKNIVKSIFMITALLAGMNACFASSLTALIDKSSIDKTSTIAVSVKEADTGKTVYEYNQNKLLHPASTLKIFTVIPALETLKDDYEFKTGFYVYDNSLYVKLGADPLLTSENIKTMVKSLKSEGYRNINSVYFDDSIMDNVEWGVGWMWDDGTNRLMPKFSAYNINGNVAKIEVSKLENGNIVANTDAPMTVVNMVKKGNENKLYVARHDWTSPDLVYVSGTLKDKGSIDIPVNNTQNYFRKVLFYYLNRYNVKVLNKTCLYGKVPEDAKKVSEVSHSVNSLTNGVFKDSNNLYAETIAKIAGGVNDDVTANLSSQVKLFYDFWDGRKVPTYNIKIADASGVSRNNLLTTDFMSNALVNLYNNEGFDKMKEYLAQPGDEGTFANRMLDKRGSVYLKTGTLANISGLTGYVVTNSGKTYAVAILIQNFTYPTKEIKDFENSLIENIINK